MLPRVNVVPRPTAQDALSLGRRRFRAGERIDMSAVAADLGVNRVTLYRWFGSRDQYLSDVVWSLAERLLADVGAGVRAQGAERLVLLVTRFVDATISDPGMQRWLREEGEHAMRLLTRHETRFQTRLIDAVQELLEQERRDGRLDVPVDAHELAYVVVRLIESYIYLDLITGEQPDATRIEPILRLLLRTDG
jgi:AcrR family transcriptional regulator